MSSAGVEGSQMERNQSSGNAKNWGRKPLALRGSIKRWSITLWVQHPCLMWVGTPMLRCSMFTKSSLPLLSNMLFLYLK
jgi:hypothetical protein